MLDITGANLEQLVKEVYALSRPVGMGHLHYVPGPLDDTTARDIATRGGQDRGDGSTQKVFMDYVKGRQCKFYAWEKNGRLFTDSYWLDHTQEQHAELWNRLGIVPKEVKE